MSTEKTDTLGTVLSKAGRARSNGAAGSPPSADAIYERTRANMAQFIETRQQELQLKALNGSEAATPKETLGEQATGLAALITALSTVVGNKGDATAPMMAILEYVKNQKEDTLRAEVAEIRQAMTQGGGDSTLATIQALSALGLVNKTREEGGLLQTIQVLKELGLVGPGAAGAQPAQSPIGAARELMSFVNEMVALRTPAAGPGTMIQIGDGKVSLQDWLTVEEFKDKRRERQEAAEDKRERLRTGREMVGEIATALAGAAAGYRRGEAAAVEADAPKKAIPQQAESSIAQVNCDHCGEANQVDVSKRPAEVKCASCGENFPVEYDNG